MRLKSESRIVSVFNCDNEGVVALIFRGAQRVEAVFHAENVNKLIETLKQSRYFAEIRAAWPQFIAEFLSVPSISVYEYVGECRNCLKILVKSLCDIFRRQQ